jgi:hypothetical protein
MITHTQTRLIPHTDTQRAKGNCWQTCAAAILEIPIGSLPDQVDVEDAGWSFNNALIAYLAKHHGKRLVYLRQWDLAAPVTVNRDVFHIICGPSPRTAANGVNHCVVGYAGTPFWDVHPSRAGLIGVNEFQFIVDHAPGAELPNIRFADRDCLCPACGGIVAKPEREPPEIVVKEFPHDKGTILVGAESWVHEYIRSVDLAIAIDAPERASL